MNSVIQSVTDFLSSRASSSSMSVGAQLTTILHNYQNEIHIPRIVVVGTQSSGKTSVLSGIIGLPILPTGSTIITRPPIHIELCPIASPHDTCIVVNNKSIPLPYESYTQEDLDSISQTIDRITNEYTHNTMNISTKPIYIKVKYIGIPHLYLIDLPGLTLLARTDEGQPKDIKTQIRNLVRTYIDIDNTYILAIVAARADIETDMALELIKEHDTTFQRTLGVLTKVDLMNESSNDSIMKYLEHDTLCIDLRMKYKYIAVRNFSKNQHEEEAHYFQSHAMYGKMYTSIPDRFGIHALTEKCICILQDALHIELPKIQVKIQDNIKRLDTQLSVFQNELDPESFRSELHTLITSMCFASKEQLNGRGTEFHYGKNIKEIFCNFRQQIGMIDPLHDYSDDEIQSILQNVEGNHMTLSIPSIDTIEFIMTTNTNNPIHLIKTPSFDSIDCVAEEMKELIQTLISRCPRMKSYPTCQDAMNAIFISYIDACVEETKPSFRKNILIHEPAYDETDSLKKIVNAYFSTIVFQCQEYIPKVIMHSLVNVFQNTSVHKKIYDRITAVYSLPSLFSIPSSIRLEKQKRMEERKALIESQCIINTYMKQ